MLQSAGGLVNNTRWWPATLSHFYGVVGWSWFKDFNKDVMQSQTITQQVHLSIVWAVSEDPDAQQPVLASKEFKKFQRMIQDLLALCIHCLLQFEDKFTPLGQ